MAYATADQVLALTSTVISERSVIKDAAVVIFIDLVAAEIDARVSRNYVLPITVAASPLAHAHLATVNALGAAALVLDAENAANDPDLPVSNPLRTAYNRALAMPLPSDALFIDAFDRVDGDDSLLAMIRAWIEAATANVVGGGGPVTMSDLPIEGTIVPGTSFTVGPHREHIILTPPALTPGSTHSETQIRSWFVAWVQDNYDIRNLQSYGPSDMGSLAYFLVNSNNAWGRISPGALADVFTEDWAQPENDDVIPLGKWSRSVFALGDIPTIGAGSTIIPITRASLAAELLTTIGSNFLSRSQIVALIASWAQAGNTDVIPPNKILSDVLKEGGVATYAGGKLVTRTPYGNDNVRAIVKDFAQRPSVPSCLLYTSPSPRD